MAGGHEHNNWRSTPSDKWDARPGESAGWRGWGMGAADQRLYDSQKVSTVSGTVDSVESLAPLGGIGVGVHLSGGSTGLPPHAPASTTTAGDHE